MQLYSKVLGGKVLFFEENVLEVLPEGLSIHLGVIRSFSQHRDLHSDLQTNKIHNT